MITKKFFKKAAKIGSEESHLSLKLRLKPSSLSKWGGTHSEVKSLQGIRSLWGTKLPYPQISCLLLPEFFSSPPSSSPSTLLHPWGALILRSFFFPPEAARSILKLCVQYTVSLPNSDLEISPCLCGKIQFAGQLLFHAANHHCWGALGNCAVNIPARALFFQGILRYLHVQVRFFHTNAVCTVY